MMNGSTLAGQLPHLGVLRFTGPDAADFLQGQLSNDTRRLGQGHAVLAAYSSPQGRVLAVIYLLPHSQGVVGILPRELVGPTLERLRKFVLRAKVKIEDASATLGVAGLDAPALAARTLTPPAPGRYAEHDGIGMAQVGRDARFWLLASPERLAALALEADAGLHWRLADIDAGLPQVYAATTEAFVAQMLNLDRLDGISFTKGCYTGQEIIARTQHLGRIKRRMFHLRLADGEWQIGQAIRLDDGRHGRITELGRRGTDTEMLAVLNLEGEPQDTAAPAVSAQQVPLPYALSD
jgi:folate-binding protein YgfZ